jgi:hypothetical protein
MGALRRPKKWVVALLSVIGLLALSCGLVGFVTGIGRYDLPPKSRGRDRVDNEGAPATSMNKEGDTVFKHPPKFPKGS